MKTVCAITILLFALISTPSNSSAENSSLPAINFLLSHWACEDDDPSQGIYRICNYFPLTEGNQWSYTTGDRLIKESKTCSSGYSGVRYSSTVYEYDTFIQNAKYGFMFAGCQYEMPENEFQEGERIILIKPEMKIGETYNEEHPDFNLSTTLIGFESVTVPAGTYQALKVAITTTATDGSCSFKTTLWLVKNIGPVKIHRTESNPADCGGCMFVCRPDNNLILLNTPAELTSFTLSQ